MEPPSSVRKGTGWSDFVSFLDGLSINRGRMDGREESLTKMFSTVKVSQRNIAEFFLHSARMAVIV